MKKVCLLLLLCGLLLSGCSSSSNEKYTIGVITWMTHPALDAAVDGMSAQVKEALGEDNVDIQVKNANEDAGTAQLIAKDFVTSGVDLIYAIATPSAQAAYAASMDSGIPVIFAAVTDAVEAGIVESNEVPGTNVSGVSDAAPLETQLKLIKEILPNATKIGMLYTLSEVNGKIQVDQAKEIAATLGLTVIEKGISADSEISTAAQQLAEQVDAIYNITDNKVVSATATIVNQANNAGIPVFAAEDGQMAQGLLASDSLSYEGMGKEAGDMIVSVLKDGADVATLPVITQGATTLYINEKVAEALEITLPQSVLDRATIADKD